MLQTTKGIMLKVVEKQLLILSLKMNNYLGWLTEKALRTCIDNYNLCLLSHLGLL